MKIQAEIKQDLHIKLSITIAIDVVKRTLGSEKNQNNIHLQKRLYRRFKLLYSTIYLFYFI